MKFEKYEKIVGGLLKAKLISKERAVKMIRKFVEKKGWHELSIKDKAKYMAYIAYDKAKSLGKDGIKIAKNIGEKGKEIAVDGYEKSKDIASKVAKKGKVTANKVANKMKEKVKCLLS